jgi:hypothetical protein
MTKSTSASDKTVASTEGVVEGGCTHHWVIEPPNGAVSRGKCKHCGIDQEFRNSFEYSSWYGTKSPNANAKKNEAKPAPKPKA